MTRLFACSLAVVSGAVWAYSAIRIVVATKHMNTWDLEPAHKFAYNALFLTFIAGLLLVGSVAYAAARLRHWSIRRSLISVESGLFTSTALAVLIASLM